MHHLMLATLGGGIGAGARYLVNVGAARCLGAGFPWSTIIFNIAGCFAMGVLAEVMANRFPDAAAARVFLMTGILGGFTTFSAFSLDTAALIGQERRTAALAYVLASVVVSILAFYAGSAAALKFRLP